MPNPSRDVRKKRERVGETLEVQHGGARSGGPAVEE